MKAFARIAIRLSLLAAPASAIACATSRFDQHLAAHRWMQAAHAFEADPALRDRESDLYRAAFLYAAPEKDTYRPGHARELFARLLQIDPAQARAAAARGMIGLLDRIAADSVREEGMRQELDSLRSAVGRLQDENAALSSRSRTTEELNQVLRGYTARLEADVRERDERLRVLGDELDRLKQIDLEPPARPRAPVKPGTGATPPRPGTAHSNRGRPDADGRTP